MSDKERRAGPGGAEPGGGTGLTPGGADAGPAGGGTPTAADVLRLVSPRRRGGAATPSPELTARGLLGLDATQPRPSPLAQAKSPPAARPSRATEDPAKRELHRERARVHREAGLHHLEFIELVRAVNAATPTPPLVHALRQAGRRAGSGSDLAAVLESALRGTEGAVSALLRRALARELRHSGRLSEARSQLYQLLAELPDDRRAVRVLAELTRREERWDEHDSALATGIELELSAGRLRAATRLSLQRARSRAASEDWARCATASQEAAELGERAGDGAAVVAARASAAAALACSGAATAEVTGAAQLLLEGARALGDASLAAAAAAGLAAECPAAAAILVHLADALFREGDSESGEKLLRDSALAQPELEPAARRLEGRLAARADWAALAAFLRDRAGKHPDRLVRAELLGRAAELLEDELGEPGAAAALYAELAALTGDPGALAAQRRLLEESGDLAGALLALDEAVRRAPDVPAKVGALLARAQVKQERDDRSGAVTDLRRALALEPANVPALSALAGLGEVPADELADALADLPRRAPARAEAVRALARTYDAERRDEEARGAWEERLDERPDDAEAIGRLRELYLLQGDHAATAALLSELLAREPRSRDAGERRRALARALEAGARPDEALPHWRQAAREVPADPEALLGLAENREAAGELAEAIWAYEGAAASHPEGLVRARLYRRLSGLVLADGDTRRATIFRHRAALLYQGGEAGTEELAIPDDAELAWEPATEKAPARFRLADDDADESTAVVQDAEGGGAPARLGDDEHDERTDVGAIPALELPSSPAPEFGEETLVRPAAALAEAAGLERVTDPGGSGALVSPAGAAGPVAAPGEAGSGAERPAGARGGSERPAGVTVFPPRPDGWVKAAAMAAALEKPGAAAAKASASGAVVAGATHEDRAGAAKGAAGGGGVVGGSPGIADAAAASVGAGPAGGSAGSAGAGSVGSDSAGSASAGSGLADSVSAGSVSAGPGSAGSASSTGSGSVSADPVRGSAAVTGSASTRAPAPSAAPSGSASGVAPRPAPAGSAPAAAPRPYPPIAPSGSASGAAPRPPPPPIAPSGPGSGAAPRPSPAGASSPPSLSRPAPGGAATPAPSNSTGPEPTASRQPSAPGSQGTALRPEPRATAPGGSGVPALIPAVVLQATVAPVAPVAPADPAQPSAALDPERTAVASSRALVAALEASLRPETEPDSSPRTHSEEPRLAIPRMPSYLAGGILRSDPSPAPPVLAATPAPAAVPERPVGPAAGATVVGRRRPRQDEPDPRPPPVLRPADAAPQGRQAEPRAAAPVRPVLRPSPTPMAPSGRQAEGAGPGDDDPTPLPGSLPPLRARAAGDPGAPAPERQRGSPVLAPAQRTDPSRAPPVLHPTASVDPGDAPTAIGPGPLLPEALLDAGDEPLDETPIGGQGPLAPAEGSGAAAERVGSSTAEAASLAPAEGSGAAAERVGSPAAGAGDRAPAGDSLAGSRGPVQRRSGDNGPAGEEPSRASADAAAPLAGTAGQESPASRVASPEADHPPQRFDGVPPDDEVTPGPGPARIRPALTAEDRFREPTRRLRPPLRPSPAALAPRGAPGPGARAAPEPSRPPSLQASEAARGAEGSGLRFDPRQASLPSSEGPRGADGSGLRFDPRQASLPGSDTPRGADGSGLRFDPRQASLPGSEASRDAEGSGLRFDPRQASLPGSETSRDAEGSGLRFDPRQASLPIGGAGPDAASPGLRSDSRAPSLPANEPGRSDSRPPSLPAGEAGQSGARAEPRPPPLPASPPPLPRGSGPAPAGEPAATFASLMAEARSAPPPRAPAPAPPPSAAPAPPPPRPERPGAAFGALLAEAEKAQRDRPRPEPAGPYSDEPPAPRGRGAAWDPRPAEAPEAAPQIGKRLSTGRYRAEAGPRARLAEDPLDAEAHRSLASLARARGELRRAALHRSALLLGGEATDAERDAPRVEAAEGLPLGADEVLGLAPDELGHPAAQLLAAAAPAVHAVYGRPWRKVDPFLVEAGRAAPAIADALISAVRLLGLRAPELILDDGAGAAIEVVLGDPPKLGIRRIALDTIRSPAVLRFAAGRALFAATPELSAVLVIPAGELEATVRALAAAARHGEDRLSRDEARLAKRLRKHLPPKELERLERLSLALDHGDPFSPAALVEAAQQAAERAGLLLGGDLEAAAQVLGEAGRPREAVLALCLFSASESYLGIAGRARLL